MRAQIETAEILSKHPVTEYVEMLSSDPPNEIQKSSQLSDFRKYCEIDLNKAMDDASFFDFSVQNPCVFWKEFVEWSGIAYEGSLHPVCTDDRCEHASFFPNLTLSYAEVLLRAESDADDARIAITACDGSGVRERLTRREVRRRVLRLAEALRRLGVVPGDRVVAVMRSSHHAVVAALASSAVGAAFSSATPEMGAPAILDRFQQLAPQVLILHLAAADEALDVRLAQKRAEVVQGLTSLKAIVTVDADGADHDFDGHVVHLPTLLAERGAVGEAEAAFDRFPFNHPLFILFSSGTTGRPKCIMHGAGGTLIEHLKEHRLHGDLRSTDTMFFHTTTAWMMWNWQLSALACRCEIVLFDGPVCGPETLWDIVARQGVTVFGTSPAFLKLCEDSGYVPKQAVPLSALRAVLSTGSVLQEQQFDWVRTHVGEIPLQSISGGTDIIGCFVLGHPDRPVRRGEAQCRSLGLDVRALHDGEAAPAGIIGELVCCNPFPSRPLGFFGDADGARFHAAYFRQNPGLWTHGDRIAFSPEGGARLHGRSDSTINVNGIRIGPSEIYRVLHDLPEIREAMAVEQQTSGQTGLSRMVLLVVPQAPGGITDQVRMRIRTTLAQRASTAHVPAMIAEVAELPVTHSGKRSEAAARDALNGVRGANGPAVANPDCLCRIREAVEGQDRGQVELELAGGLSRRQAIRRIWGAILNVPDVPPDASFFDLGGTSLLAIRLCGAISDHLGATVGPWVLFQAPTLRLFTAVLEDARLDASLVIPLRLNGGGRPIFIVPGMFGDVMELRALAATMPEDRPIYGLRARGLAPGERPHTRVPDAARDYLAHLRRLQPSGPYCLAGYSFGGLVALELACLLREAGDEVAFLGLIDTNVHDASLRWPERLRFWMRRLVGYTVIAARSPMVQVPALCRAYLSTRVRSQAQPRSQDRSFSPQLWRIAKTNRRAFTAYRPRLYDGPMTVFTATKRWPRFCDPLLVWRRIMVGDLLVCAIDGAHTDLVQEPHVGLLAERLSALLARATGEVADHASDAAPHVRILRGTGKRVEARASLARTSLIHILGI